MPIETEVQSVNQRKNIEERRAVKDLDDKNSLILDNTSQINSNVAQIKEEINSNIDSKIEEVKEAISEVLPTSSVSSESGSEVIDLLNNILEEVGNIKEETNNLKETITEIQEEIKTDT